MQNNDEGEMVTPEVREAVDLYNRAIGTGANRTEARLEVRHTFGGIPDGFDSHIHSKKGHSSASLSATRTVTR